MNRLTLLVTGSFAALVAAGLWLAGAGHEHAAAHPAGPSTAQSAVLAEAPPMLAASGEPPASAGSSDAEVLLPEAVAAGGGLPALDAMPSLPALENAPKSVSFGVVLLVHREAEGAKPGQRTRAAALALANELTAIARDDFAAAVKKGDPGSLEKAGKMYRGILEPTVEYAMFSLSKGEIGKPVDTPRGYWIIKRID